MVVLIIINIQQIKCIGARSIPYTHMVNNIEFDGENQNMNFAPTDYAIENGKR